jgi:hypothetical protein
VGEKDDILKEFQNKRKPRDNYQLPQPKLSSRKVILPLTEKPK